MVAEIRSPRWRPILKEAVAASVVALVLTLSYFGRALLPLGGVPQGLPLTPFTFCGVFLGGGALSFLIYHGLATRPWESLGWVRNLERRLKPGRTMVAVSAVLLFLAWLPYLVLARPFAAGPDTVAQLLWWTGHGAFDPSSKAALAGFAMSDHHPVLDTLLYGCFYDLGAAFGKPAWGLFLLVLLQSAAIAWSLGAALSWARGRGLGALGCTGLFLTMALVPAVPIWCAVIVKDMTAVPFMVMAARYAIDLAFPTAEDRSGRFRHNLLGYLGSSTAAVLLRRSTNVTILALGVLSLVVLCAAAARRRRHPSPEDPRAIRGAAALLGGSVVCVLLATGLNSVVLLPLFHAAPSGPQEMLSIPTQQAVAVLRAHGAAIGDDERRALEAVLPLTEAEEAFNPLSADPVKDLWKRDSTGADRTAFLKTWLGLVARYPGEAFDGVKYLSIYLTSGTDVAEHLYVWGGWEERGSAELFPGYDGKPTAGQTLVNGVSETWFACPGLRIPMEVVTYTLWIPVVVLGWLALQGDGRRVAALIMVWSFAAPCLLVAAAQCRYAMPSLFLVPVLFGAVAAPRAGKPEPDAAHFPHGAGNGTADEKTENLEA